jgi:CHAT domain-containing protein/tetratricopeptide (TPR) repeat protein
VLGDLYCRRNNFTAAEALAQELLALTRQRVGEEHPDFSVCLDLLVRCSLGQGKYALAESLAQRSLAMLRARLGDRHPKLVPCLNNLVDVYRDGGKYADAEPLARQSLELVHHHFGENHPQYAFQLNRLAGVCAFLHNHPTAEALFQQALEVLRRVGKEGSADHVATMNNLAQLYMVMGRPSAAEPLFRRVLATRGVLEKLPDYGMVLSNVGLLHQQLGDTVEAEAVLRQAVEVGRRTMGENDPRFATILNNLALVHLDQGDHASAERLFEETLRILAATVGPSHPNYASTLHSLALCHAATDRAEEALTLLTEAEAVNDQMIGQVFSLGSEGNRTTYLGSAQIRLSLARFLSCVLTYLPDSLAGACAALELVWRRKGLGAEALAVQRDAVLGGRYPALAPRLRELTALRQRVAALALAGPGVDGLEACRRKLAEASVAKEAVEVELVRQIPEMSLARQLAAADHRTVVRALPPSSALVEFVRFPVYDFQAHRARGQSEWRPPRYAAFVLLSGQPDSTRLIDLGEAEPLDRLIADFRTAITGEAEKRPGRNLVLPGARPAVAASPNGEVLREALFGKLTRALNSCKRLLLAPEGDLTRLPFEALPLGGGYLIDDYQISYLGTGRDVLRFGAAASGSAAPPLVAADPEFDLGTDPTPPPPSAPQPGFWARLFCRRRALPRSHLTLKVPRPSPAGTSTSCYGSHVSHELRESGVRFLRLPGTRVEGERIGQRLGVVPLMGAAVLKGYLKACCSPRLLHLSTHGFFLEDQKLERSRDNRNVGVLRLEGGAPSGRLPAQGLENPLLRSGLALSGVNTWLQGDTPPAEAEDGLLTAEDVSGLDLVETELVVLSACETGLGAIHTGEGVFGLRRAFTVAGAKTLVMSLWKVPDLATAFLMDRLYDGLLTRGLERDLALAAAQRATREVTVGQLRREWLGEATIERLAGGDAGMRRVLHELADQPDDLRPFAHPYYWGAFICQGDTRPLHPGPS